MSEGNSKESYKIENKTGKSLKVSDEFEKVGKFLTILVKFISLEKSLQTSRNVNSVFQTRLREHESQTNLEES